jgi:phosphoribosylanthranilate isomerase
VTQVKICGITTAEDALMAAEAGADLLGLVFYPPSSRYVTADRACQIAEAVRGSLSPVRLVGVFVDVEPAAIRSVMDSCGLDVAQLHGSESPEVVAELTNDGMRVFKAFRIRDAGSLREIPLYAVSAYLLDTYVRGQPGGTGHTFNWALAERAKAHGPILLAGGLTQDNVAQAIAAVRPWAVDVSSSVEGSPGRKDAGKVLRFISAVKQADQLVSSSNPSR